MIEDLSDVVGDLATGTYQVLRQPPTEYDANGRRGIPTICLTAWVPSVYQFYAPNSRVRNPAVNVGSSFSNALSFGNAGTVAAWPFIAGHYHDGATLLWDAVGLNPADPLWVPSVPSHYLVGQQRFNGAEVYQCTVEGDAATAVGPVGRGVDIVDGTAHWKWVGPKMPAALSVVISVQPLNGRELDRLPEGLRTREVKKGYTATQLFTAGANQEPDRIVIDGDTYQVERVERWDVLAGYWKVLASKSGR